MEQNNYPELAKCKEDVRLNKVNFSHRFTLQQQNRNRHPCGSEVKVPTMNCNFLGSNLTGAFCCMSFPISFCLFPVSLLSFFSKGMEMPKMIDENVLMSLYQDLKQDDRVYP